ncbi:MAG TPA: VPLPA-CTERM-specific exosortase XrtD [Desulfobaccales bacterium]|nr:VPLPA-CTERM-specific exosortase XrtD [Desulfobaccales bacterium]
MANEDKAFSRLIPITMALLALAVLWFYWPVLAKLFGDLAENEDYSFGLLLPLVSGYIVYLKLPQIRSYLWRPSWLGLLFMAVGFAFYIVGELGADLYIPRLSFVIVITGLLFLMGGWSLVRLLLFPLFLLILMFPLPGLLTKQLTMPLQLISSRLATAMLQMVGIPAFCQGNVIDLGVRQMQMVEACSGLRYILALLALGVIFCYFFQRCLWKILLLLMVLIPSAIVANALRVMAMGIIPALLSPGFWHAFSGWLIFVFCLGILSLINRILNKIQPGTAIPPDPFAPPIPTPRSALAIESYLVLAVVLVGLGGPIATLVGRAPGVALGRSFDHFPLELGHWHGQLAYIDPEMVKATKSDAHLNAEFRSPGQPPISLWIAYYKTQKKAGGFVHSPKLCLTGGGWTHLNTGIGRLGKDMPVNYLILQQMGTSMVVYYWYLQRGRWFTNEYLNKLYMVIDGLTRRRTDGALIRLITPAEPNVEAARKRLDAFALQLAPVLPHFIPN